jgi:HK97 family phage portal protein
MAFTVTEGQILAAHRASYTAPSGIRLSDDYTADYAAIYRTQPEVRVVVEFLARNVQQLALQTFQRLGDRDRRRLRDHPLAQLLRKPNTFTHGNRLIRDLVSDRGIYDRALWVKTFNADGSPALLSLPPVLWEVDGERSNWLAPEWFKIHGTIRDVSVPADRVVYFRGYNPLDRRQGLSPIEGLRRTLSEAHAANVMREQSMRNGARISGYITRPKDAKWGDSARERFRDSWRGQYQGMSATQGAGTPLLEDGMTFVPAAQTAEELQYVEARKLTREEVAAAYFIPPPMIGILDHATFSNISEQHKMLYADTLGPILEEIQAEIELQLVPDYGDDRVYVEFNLMEKLKGSFEEQATQLQTAVGAPYVTRNEARARQNLAPIDGGDELVVPLNVLIGGQASPTDSAPPAGGGGAIEAARPSDPAVRAIGAGSGRQLRTKQRPAESYIEKARQVLSSYFEKQSGVVRSRLGAKDAEWWDGERWDRELSGVLLALSSSLSPEIARKALEKLGEDPDAYSVDQTLAYLAAVAGGNAKAINTSTRTQLELAAEDDEDPKAAVAAVFDRATGARSAAIALTVTTAIAGFATVEAAKQAAGSRKASKTWVVTSQNPRSSHAAMNGETVGIDETFSNGASWPGDSSALDADEIAGCECDTVIEIGD